MHDRTGAGGGGKNLPPPPVAAVAVPTGGGTPENLKMQVTEVSRYEVFGESGWRGSIRLVELVSSIKYRT